MRTFFRKWWIGMELMVIGSAPWAFTLYIVERYEPPLVNGFRPLWWRGVTEPERRTVFESDTEDGLNC
jgi:hypothetical protein